MSNVLALIPARSGSQGVKHKNFALLCGSSPLQRAIAVAYQSGCEHTAVTSDRVLEFGTIAMDSLPPVLLAAVLRPPELAQDDTPMVDVVRHALEQIPGPPDQQVVLLQPTQPLRTPKHIQQALALLTVASDSVVSVVEVPRTHNPEWQYRISDGYLETWPGVYGWRAAARRQDLEPSYIRDGTCYAFWRKTVEQYGNIYGSAVRPLIIDPSETCPLDTPADWAEAERRLRERT